MFMVKDEFANLRNLLKVRFKNGKKPFIWIFIILGGFLLSSLIGIISAITDTSNPVHFYTVSDNSITLLIGMFVGFVVGNIMYRSTNAKLSVFPQTNNSRFISWLLYNYSIAIIVSVVLLITYSIQYGVLMLMSIFTDSVHLALDFSFGFTFAGFFVYIIYSFLILSIILLIGAVIRKWSYYAIATLITLFTLIIINLEMVIFYIQRVLSFLITEPSIILFSLKAIGLWLLITAVTLVINYYTVYYKSQNWVLKRRITIACIIIAVVITIITPMVFNFSVTISSNQNTGATHTDGGWSYSSDHGDSSHFIDHYNRIEEIRIDISHLPDGVNININGENIYINDHNAPNLFSSNNLIAFISGWPNTQNVRGDTLVIQYRPPWYTVNGIDILKFANPQVSAFMEGNTLFINYTFDKTTVIIMPVWSIVRQFDIFANKNLLTAHAMGSSGGGSMSVNIFIDVE